MAGRLLPEHAGAEVKGFAVVRAAPELACESEGGGRGQIPRLKITVTEESGSEDINSTLANPGTAQLPDSSIRSFTIYCQTDQNKTIPNKLPALGSSLWQCESVPDLHP